MTPAVAPRPRPYYGWIIVLALSLTETTSWGILYYGFSVFLPSLERDTGWTRAQTTGAFSLALLLSGLMAIPVGRWLDRHGARALMTVGSVAGVLLVLAWSQVTDLMTFYLIWAGIGLAMAAVLYDPAFAVVAHWFERGRQRAFTLLTFVAGLASLIFNPLNAWLIQAQGWRSALVSAAIVLAVLTIPAHALILRRRPADIGLRPDGVGPPAERASAAPSRPDGMPKPEELGPAGGDTQPPAGTRLPAVPHPVSALSRARPEAGHRASAVREAGDLPPGAAPSVPLSEAFRTATFWMLNTAIVLMTLASVTITVHLIPYLIGRGYEPGFAALSIGLIGGMQLPGRLAFLPLGRRLSRRALTICVALLQCAALIVLALFDSLAGVLLFVALFGMANGMATLARATLVVEFFGPAHYGSINGWVAFFATVARGIAPLGAGLMFTAFAGYGPVLWTLVGASAVAALCFHLAEVWWARRGTLVLPSPL